MTVTLSLAMIVKDEGQVIGRVLADGAAVCDEMIVIDTGSTDRTREIAAERGANVQEVAWRDDFAAARNASFAWCSCEWILWLDADDVLPEGSKQALRDLKEWLHDGIDGVLAPYHYVIAEDGTVLLNVNRERLIRRGSGHKWEGRVHEYLPIPADRMVLVPELVIEHRPDPARRALNRDRNLLILQKEVAGGHPTQRSRFYYANELFDHGRYTEAVQAYGEFLEQSKTPGPERYWAHLCIADCGRTLDDDELIRRASLDAIGEDPARPEGYISLGRYFFDKEQWDRAAPLFLAATAGRPPLFGFLRSADYGFAPWDYLTVCFDRLGRPAEGLAAAQRALPGNPQADRVRANMHWMVDNL